MKKIQKHLKPLMPLKHQYQYQQSELPAQLRVAPPLQQQQQKHRHPWRIDGAAGQELPVLVPPSSGRPQRAGGARAAGGSVQPLAVRPPQLTQEQLAELRLLIGRPQHHQLVLGRRFAVEAMDLEFFHSVGSRLRITQGQEMALMLAAFQTLHS